MAASRKKNIRSKSFLNVGAAWLWQYGAWLEEQAGLQGPWSNLCSRFPSAQDPHQAEAKKLPFIDICWS